MKDKTFIIECFEGAEAKRTYIIREMPDQPGVAPKTVAVCENGDEIAQFFDNVEIV